MAKFHILLFCILFTFSLAAQTVNRYDVVISEFMSDPTPQVGLPNSEWVELKNTSPVAINLQGWRIGDAGAISGPMPSFILQPDSFVIVTTSGAVAALSPFGRVISVTSFPSLDNDGDRILIQNAQGIVIHAIDYSITWFDNAVKAAGGWTLEMIDPKNPCTGQANWKPSIDPAGGTPGKKNSVDAVNNDQTPPQLLRAYATDNSTIVAVFNEPIDSLSASISSRFTINQSITITSAAAQSPMFTTVTLRLSTPLQPGVVYKLTATGITDCKGNTIGIYNHANIGIAADVAAGDLVINEILFNPRPNANDFVEVYNRSNKILDANKLIIANRNSAGVISSFRNFTDRPYLIFPGDYIVLTPDVQSLLNTYLVQQPENVIPITLPSFPNDKGTVVVTNAQGTVIDEVSYSEKWHFQLISNRQGISLERIDPSGPSQDPLNWTSAASTVGYATPTYKNSQFKQAGNITGMIEVSPKVFSPDNDGIDDVATINYQVTDPGYIANVTIFDASGRPVRYLVRNGTLGFSGRWNWDGLGEKSQKLPIGTYIIYTEIFTTDGKRKNFKNTVVLARKLN